MVAALISLAVALAVRLTFLAEAWDSPFLAHALIDEQDYRDLALRLARGEWPGHEALFRPPLYPAFLSSISLTAPHFSAGPPCAAGSCVSFRSNSRAR